jgi:hypothetical protein
MEILVAMSLFVLVGSGLVAFLNQAVRIWRTSESRGVVYERARAVLDRVADDLRATITQPTSETDAGWIRFVADEGAGGRQRLRFVRTTSGETADGLLREGGRFLLERTPAIVDGIADPVEAASGLLAAPAGSMEVFYMLDPRPGTHLLWRAMRAPAGGPGSLLVDRNVEPSRVSEREAGERIFLEEFAVPVSRDVLHVGFRFWTPSTNTWRDVPPRVQPRRGEASGPVLLWDSTRALIERSRDPGQFGWTRRGGSLDDPSDDVFPERVEVTVVIRGDYDSDPVRLAAVATELADTLRVSGRLELPEEPLDRFVLVGDEWMRVEALSGDRLKVAAGGRGARFTQPAKHVLGTLVETGVTFRRVVDIPAYRRQR